MPFTLADIAPEVQNRLEEPLGPGIFWDRVGEIYPSLAWAALEATLITGEPEIQQTSFTLTADTTVFSIPAAAVALVRIQAPQWLEKTSVWDLDRMTPGWESDTGDTPDAWFPIGLTQFGIHPLLNAPVTASLTYIALPVPILPVYTGTEIIDFQTEYMEAFVDYSAHILQAKEGGEEFKQSMKLYDRFLSQMIQLSSFSWRKNSLKFTRTVGAPARLNPVEHK